MYLYKNAKLKIRGMNMKSIPDQKHNKTVNKTLAEARKTKVKH